MVYYYMASIRFDESCNLIGQFEVQILPWCPLLPSQGITKFLMPYKTKHNKTVKTCTRVFLRNVNCCKNERFLVRSLSRFLFAIVRKFPNIFIHDRYTVRCHFEKNVMVTGQSVIISQWLSPDSRATSINQIARNVIVTSKFIQRNTRQQKIVNIPK